MDALSRQEYPAMLVSIFHPRLAPVLMALQGRLPPGQAVAKLNDRVKKIGKVNTEIADWLQV